MSAFFALLAEFAPSVGTTLVVRGSAVLLAALLIVAALGRASAATRYGVWALAFVALALVPMAMGALPRWTVTLPMPGTPAPHVAGGAEMVFTAPQVAVASPQHALGPTAEPSPALRETPVVLGPAVLIWMIGVGLLLARLAAHACAAARVVRRAKPARTGHICAVLRELGRPSLHVVVSEETVVPMVAGVGRQAVVLPGDAEAWPRDLLRSVLAHELAHVDRQDYAMHLVARIAVALYWPNPLVWLGARRLAAEQERACDDRAIEVNPPQVYATHLLNVARLLNGPGTAGAALAMAGRHAVLERIRSIITPGIDRRPASRLRLLLAAVALALVAVPVAMMAIRPPPAPDPYLLAALDDPDVTRRQRAAWGLGEFESRRGVMPLLERIDDPDPSVRGTIVWALGEIKDRRAVASLVNVLERDPDVLVREMAAVALGEIRARAAVSPLLAAAKREPGLAPAVAWALGEIDHAAAQAARREIWFDTPHAGRWIEGHEQARRSAPPATVETALATLLAPDPAVRTHAAWSLGRLGDLRAVDRLLAAMRDSVREVRAIAVWALDEINPSRGDP